MKSKFLGKFLPQALAWAAVVALSGAIAMAQDAAPAQRTDGQIEMDVVHALDASNALKQDLITAATIQSEVTLSGTVSNEASKELAEAIASRVAGVTKVNDNLKVGNPQDAQTAEDAAQPAPAPDPAPAADNSQPQSASGPAPDPGAAPYPAQAPPPSASPDPAPSMQAQGSMPPPPPPGARPEYAAVRPRVQKYADPTGPVTVSQGTLLRLRTSEFVDSKKAKDGAPVQFMVIEDVASGGVLAIPRGATVHGVVTEVKHAGALAGSSELALKLTSLDLGGQSYPLETDQFKVKAPNKAGQTVESAIGGGIIGTIIGCAAGRGMGCAVGAGAGVAAGTAASAASPGARAWIPAEALVEFHLSAPLTVTPVDKQEAARLAQGLYPGGPNLYRRGPGYGYYGGYGSPYPYPYAYAPVYYRPYYVAGGYYYWR